MEKVQTSNKDIWPLLILDIVIWVVFTFWKLQFYKIAF
jgi:hypothetical protein